MDRFVSIRNKMMGPLLLTKLVSTSIAHWFLGATPTVGIFGLPGLVLFSFLNIMGHQNRTQKIGLSLASFFSLSVFLTSLTIVMAMKMATILRSAEGSILVGGVVHDRASNVLFFLSLIKDKTTTSLSGDHISTIYIYIYYYY